MSAQNTPEPNFKRVHFIGIGGAGMSGIALVLHERGYEVSGSDLKTSRYIRQLTRAGIDIRIGHVAGNIDDVKPDVVVISTAIPETNPELVRARELNIPVWRRAQMLSALSHGYTTIAVAGTHGKTTTSSMCATMIDRMGLDPSFLIGGIVDGYDTNGRNGAGEHFVAEADESDGSFLYLDPDIVVVTNIEADHLDHYSGLEEIEDTFAQFMTSVGEQGTVIVCGENPRVSEIARSTGRTVITYGFDKSCDVCVTPLKHEGIASTFDVSMPNDQTYRVSLAGNPGNHNMLNASACLAVAYACNLDLSAAATALSSFEGVQRRFTQRGVVNGITIVDDYGHHPTEIKATLAAAKQLNFKRTVVVHQPHRYSRLQSFMDDFASAFVDADKLFLIDVFSAGEMPIPGVNSSTLADDIKRLHPETDVVYVDDRTRINEILAQECSEGDLLITLGAGDVTQIGPDFIEAMNA